LIPARLTHPVTGVPKARTYLHGHLHGHADERLISPIEEGGLRGLRLADSLIVLPENSGEIPAGAVVSVMPLSRS